MALEAKIYRSCMLKVEPNFDPSKANKDVLNSIFAWIWKCDKLNILGLDYNKGFFLYGPLGLGKSMTLLAMRQYMNSVTARFDHMRDDYRLKAWWNTLPPLCVYRAWPNHVGVCSELAHCGCRICPNR